MEDDPNPMRIPIVKKIDQIRRKTGFDETFVRAVAFHSKILQKCENVESRQDYCNLLMSKLFFDKMDMYPTKRFKCQVTEDSKWPVRLLPTECFGEQKSPDIYRYNCFYECLNVSDVLDCRVTTINPADYYLRVIHKFGQTMILDDLNLMVIMPKNGTDMEFLKKELLLCELIRVKVIKIEKEVKKVNIYVTVKEENQEMENLRKLGRISEEILPPYVLNPHDSERFQSYSKYLNYMPQFRNPILLNEIYSGFGIDLFRMYSFYPEYDCSKCDEEQNGQAMLKESKVLDAKNFISLSIDECKNNNFTEAFNHLEKAIEMCPQKDELAFSIYYIRGSVYSESQKPAFSLKAFSDWIKAYTLNPKDEGVRKHISLYLFQIANKYYRKKEYQKAFINAEKALQFDQGNDEANALIEYLKKKHSEIFFDGESLVTLQEKQLELRTKLKRLAAPKVTKK